MSARQRSASSLSHHTAASNASSPGGYNQSAGQAQMSGGFRQDTDPLLLSAAEIPSFHGDLAPTFYSNDPYPTMTATYIPSGLPPSRPRANTNTSSGSAPEGLSGQPPGGGYPASLQPRQGLGARHSAIPMHAGMRHVSTSVLDNSARLGSSGGHMNGLSGGFYGGHSNSSSLSIPPPPPSNPPLQPSNLPALALSQREYQPHYVPRPDYRSHSSSSHYTSASQLYSQHSGNLQVPNIPPPPPSQYQPQTYYNSGKPQQEIYRVPVPSSESLPSFARVDSSESDHGTAGQRGAPIGGAQRGHGVSPLATPNSSALSINPDVAALWTLERVLGYLERHHYPEEWQKAFKNLNIHGEEFLELAQNQGLLTYILPEVMEINPNLDESSEAVSARNIKKMIRELLRVAQTASAVEENDYPLTRSQRFGNRRSSTMPAIYQEKSGSMSEHAFGPSRGNSETSIASQRPPVGRNDVSKTVLGSVDNIRHSPSSSETNFRPVQASPQASPNLNSGGVIRHGHTPSTDSIASSTVGHRAGDGKGDKKALIMLGLASRHEKPESPHDKSASSSDFPEHRHGGGGFFGKFKKKLLPHREGLEDDDSPTSPGLKSMILPTLPFASENNGSSSSIDRASSSSLDTSRKARGQSARFAASSKPGYALATRDGRVWYTIELPEVVTGDAVRREICNNVNIREWEASSVYLTELGQNSHNDILSDLQLSNLCEKRLEGFGPLMFFIRPAPTSVVDNSSRSSLVDPTSPIKRDGLESRPMFETRPAVTGIPASDSQVTTLRSPGFEQTRISIESAAEPGRSSPTLNPEFENLIERVANFKRQHDDSPRPAQTTPSAKTKAGSNVASPVDRAPGPSSFPSEFGAPPTEMQQQTETKTSPLHQPEPLHEQQPPLLKQPTPPRRRISRPPDLEGFCHGPMATNRPKRVVDFDNPRPSPFEDRRMEDLIPQRKPPPPPLNRVPSVSYSTVQQAQEQAWPQEQRGHSGFVRRGSIQGNKMIQNPRAQAKSGGITPSYGIGSSLVSAGQQLTVVARAAASMKNEVPPPLAISRPPTNRSVSMNVGMGNSFDPPKPPGPRGLKLQIPLNSGKKTSPELSPTDLSAVIKQSSSTLHERQPEPQESGSEDGEEDDSDGDDGLFAIPIAGRGGNSGGATSSTAPTTAPNTAGTSVDSSLDVDAAKRPSVQFKTPPTSSTESNSALTAETPPSPEFEAGDDRRGISSPSMHTASNPGSASHIHSPVDYSRLGRRQSFLRDDVWASRPPAEALINHLDDFFPNLDLDQPILDDVQISPPPSPSAIPGQRPYAYQLQDPPLPSPVKEESAESPVIPTMPPPPIPKEQCQPAERSIIAQRNVKSGGLNRMKSIREVARGAHESRKRAPAIVDGKQASVMRRKSTKLFGAKLIEVTPMKGRRGMMRQREPIPTIPVQHQQQGQVGVKRQATFKWFKGELIGKGTYGRVYLGMNATTGEFLAVKQVEVSRVAGDSERQKEMIAALNQEIETMQHLDHENIVQYLGCERKEYSMSIFLEYISGGSIGSCLRKHGRFPERLVRNLTRQILQGLMYLHSEGILHRDLKADNILLDVDGTCKISDFGISKKTDNIYGDDPGNSMQGSVFWMAPEVIRPEGQGYSAKIDIWSLGCVVLEMLAGRRPWSKEEAIGAIYKLGSERQAPPIPEDVSSVVSPGAIGFLADCHTIDPSERPTAKTLLGHEFCDPDATFNFLHTELYQKISKIL
ncbi:Pkinase-domain-containing protein [Ascodesmis nigricans]|uniref:mitogen-activated protein kinase n=1 Tax=Ascodesmis nigricans TaxID=341454 RepID=A0A4S2MUF7_9PEZI|nr:Pkinase-domain-containing protein [Ascodesmis nigricans]